MSPQISFPFNVIGRRCAGSPCSMHQPGHFSRSGLRVRCHMLHQEVYQRPRIVTGTTSCFERTQGSKFHIGPNWQEPWQSNLVTLFEDFLRSFCTCWISSIWLVKGVNVGHQFWLRDPGYYSQSFSFGLNYFHLSYWQCFCFLPQNYSEGTQQPYCNESGWVEEASCSSALLLWA